MLIFVNLGLGVAVGVIEGWGVGSGLYFGCITGLTIGYGDLVPTRPLTRVLAVAIGICGIVLTGLIAAVAVAALQAAMRPELLTAAKGRPARVGVKRVVQEADEHPTLTCFEESKDARK